MNARLAASAVVVVLGAFVACGDLIGAAASGDAPDSEAGPDVLPSLGCPSGCVAPAPPGWIGPSAVFDDVIPPDGGLPSCPDTYPQPEERAWRDLDAGATACTCGAGVVTSATCTFEIRQGDMDCGNLGPPSTISIGSGIVRTCNGENGIAAYTVSTPVLDGGVCAFPTQMATKPDAVFARGAVACRGTTAPPACADRNDCVRPPPAGAPFERVCIHQAGDVACPSADYGVRFVAYHSVADDRACSPCVGSVAGLNCPTTYGIDNVCSTSPAKNSGSTDTCQNQMTGTDFVYTSDLAPAPRNCPQTGGGAATGDAHAADPVTFCCSP